MSMNDSSSEYTGDAATKDDYSSRQGQKGEVPVVSDDTKIDDPIDADTADSDKQLGKSRTHSNHPLHTRHEY